MDHCLAPDADVLPHHGPACSHATLTGHGPDSDLSVGVHVVVQEAVALPETELPLRLPDTDTFLPSGTGESPLARIEDWVSTTDPTTGVPLPPVSPGGAASMVPCGSSQEAVTWDLHLCLTCLSLPRGTCQLPLARIRDWMSTTDPTTGLHCVWALLPHFQQHFNTLQRDQGTGLGLGLGLTVIFLPSSTMQGSPWLASRTEWALATSPQV